VTRVWSARELALLGVKPDPEVARLIGRSTSAVTEKRRKLGITALAPGPRGVRSYFWTAEEDAVVRTFPPEEAARRLNRSLKAIYPRRRALGIAVKRKPTKKRSR